MNIKRINASYIEGKTPQIILETFMNTWGMPEKVNNETFRKFPFVGILLEKSQGNPAFYALEKDYKLFIYKLKDNRIKDENGNVLNNETIKDYYNSFAKGFEYGYKNFIINIKNNELFVPDNEILSLKVYERTLGFMPYGSLNTSKVETNNFKEYITANDFHEQGIKQGEFYKAWELIFDNANVFEKYFLGLHPAASTTPPQKPKAKRATAAERYPTFESMFVDKTKAAKVLELLQDDETSYKPRYKIGAITQALVNNNILKKGIPKDYRNPLFAKTLGITASKRTLTGTGNDYEESLTEFDLLFNEL